MAALEMLVLADSWGWHHDDVGIGWWIVMMLGMAVFWGGVIAFVVWLLRGGIERRNETPEETLRRRLADGSISVAEYEQRLAVMRGPAAGRVPDDGSGDAPGPQAG